MSTQDMTQESNQKNGSVKTLAIRLDPATHAQLSLIAQLRGTTLVGEIRSALDAHLANAKDAPELAAHADQALADLEADMAARKAAIANLFGTDAPTEPETRRRPAACVPKTRGERARSTRPVGARLKSSSRSMRSTRRRLIHC